MNHRTVTAGHFAAGSHTRILAPVAAVAVGIESFVAQVLRYGLVLVIAWVGAMKFTAYEAAGIEPMVANSPLLSWLYGFLSVRGFSNALGVLAPGWETPLGGFPALSAMPGQFLLKDVVLVGAALWSAAEAARATARVPEDR